MHVEARDEVVQLRQWARTDKNLPCRTEHLGLRLSACEIEKAANSESSWAKVGAGPGPNRRRRMRSFRAEPDQ
jgi:hypothetical protein